MRMIAHGADIYYEQHGDAGPPILLLHGWGCSIALWKPVIEALCKTCRVTAVDFPGHGQSGRPPIPWGAEDYAIATAQVMEALGLSGCHIIGHSHGGRVALFLAATRPELVGKLALTGAAGLHGEKTPAQRKRAAAYKRLRSFYDFLERLRIFGPLPERWREALRKKYGSRDYNALDAEMRKTFVKVVGFDIAPYLQDIQAPTLLLYGDQDRETPLWMGQRMERDIPDAGLVVLKGGSHFAYLEQLPLFLKVVKTFLLGGDV